MTGGTSDAIVQPHACAGNATDRVPHHHANAETPNDATNTATVSRTGRCDLATTSGITQPAMPSGMRLATSAAEDSRCCREMRKDDRNGEAASENSGQAPNRRQPHKMQQVPFQQTLRIGSAVRAKVFGVMHLTNGHKQPDADCNEVGAESKQPKRLRVQQSRGNPPVRRKVQQPDGVEDEQGQRRPQRSAHGAGCTACMQQRRERLSSAAPPSADRRPQARRAAGYAPEQQTAEPGTLNPAGITKSAKVNSQIRELAR